MSDLSQRCVTRRISRPNARKAIDRIEKEVEVLIEKCPAVMDESAYVYSAQISLLNMIKDLKALYRDQPK